MENSFIRRRMDHLGRIVLPKSIRQDMHIGEGDTLQLYLDQFDPKNPILCISKACTADTFQETCRKVLRFTGDCFPGTTVKFLHSDGSLLAAPKQDDLTSEETEALAQWNKQMQINSGQKSITYKNCMISRLNDKDDNTLALVLIRQKLLDTGACQAIMWTAWDNL